MWAACGRLEMQRAEAAIHDDARAGKSRGASPSRKVRFGTPHGLPSPHSLAPRRHQLPLWPLAAPMRQHGFTPQLTARTDTGARAGAARRDATAGRGRDARAKDMGWRLCFVAGGRGRTKKEKQGWLRRRLGVHRTLPKTSPSSREVSLTTRFAHTRTQHTLRPNKCTHPPTHTFSLGLGAAGPHLLLGRRHQPLQRLDRRRGRRVVRV